jgi:hypothetical protein
MRTTVSALAANDPRNVVSTSKNMNSARHVTCTTRRAHTRPRITFRAGIPDPGRFGSIFFGFTGAAAPPATVDVAAAVAHGDFTGRRGGGEDFVFFSNPPALMARR